VASLNCLPALLSKPMPHLHVPSATQPGASYGKTNARPRPKSASTLYSSTASSNTRRKANGSKPNSRGATQAPTGGSQALDMGGPLATIRSSGSLNYGNSGASPSRRPQSAREPRNSSRGNNRNRGGAGEGPSEALLSPTSTSRQYAADLAARRTAPAAALLAGIPALGVPADGGALGSNSSAAPTPPPPGGLSASPSERALAAAGITGWRVTEPGGDPYPSVTPPPEPAWRASGKTWCLAYHIRDVNTSSCELIRNGGGLLLSTSYVSDNTSTFLM
jgi:hypothetical protein